MTNLNNYYSYSVLTWYEADMTLGLELPKMAIKHRTTAPEKKRQKGMTTKEDAGLERFSQQL